MPEAGAPRPRLRAVELAPRQAGGERTVVLFHGYGADERDLLPLVHELDPRLHALSLAAPIALPYGGRAWYNLQQTPDGGFLFDPAEVQGAAALATEAVETIARASPRPLLLGFSQGAGMALTVALTRPELASGIVALSAVPPRLRPDEHGSADALRALPVFAAHGIHDPLVPVELARVTRAALEEAGLAVTYREYPIGHMVGLEEIEDARAWLARL